MAEGISGKVVVITGASSGLGEATARPLSAGGATVALGARRADRLKALAGEIEDAGGRALAVATDVRRRDQVEALVALSEGLRQEVKPYNIRTTVISPGAVATELPNGITDTDAASRVRAFYSQVALPPTRSRASSRSR